MPNNSQNQNPIQANNNNLFFIHSKPKVQIVIILHNSGDDLDFCLESITRALITDNKISEVPNTDSVLKTDPTLSSTPQTDLPLFQGSNFILDQVTIIDNTPDKPPNLIPWKNRLPLNYRPMNQNLGVSKAHNLASLESHSDYILFLHPHCFISPTAIKTAVQYMQNPNHINTAISTVLVKTLQGQVLQTTFQFPSLNSYLKDGARNNFMAHKILKWSHKESKNILHSANYFYLVRRSVFAQLKGFDSRFFIYLEDLDFSYRVHKIGYSNFFIANDYCILKVGTNLNTVKHFQLFEQIKSKIIFAEKHFSKLNYYLSLIAIFSLQFLKRIYSVFPSEMNAFFQFYFRNLSLFSLKKSKSNNSLVKKEPLLFSNTLETLKAYKKLIMYCLFQKNKKDT